MGISTKMNVIAHLDIEIVYYYVASQHVNHYRASIPQPLFVWQSVKEEENSKFKLAVLSWL